MSRKRSQDYLAGFRNGQPRSFDRVYTRFHKPILRYVRTKVRNEEVASELTQEIFLKVFRFRESYQERYAFSTWLWTIARNTVSDHLRSPQGSAATASAMADAEDCVHSRPLAATLSPEELPSPVKSPETQVLKKDQRRAFLQVFRSLTRAQRRVLRLHLVNQLSYPEIARKLGLSLTAVKNLAYRAHQSIRALLAVNAINAPEHALELAFLR